MEGSSEPGQRLICLFLSMPRRDRINKVTIGNSKQVEIYHENSFLASRTKKLLIKSEVRKSFNLQQNYSSYQMLTHGVEYYRTLNA